MKLKYVVNARIPTEKAHGYQICKMCEEFSSLGADVDLTVSRGRDIIKKDVFLFYGLRRNFKVNYLQSFDFFALEKYLGGFSYYATSLSFFIKLFFKKNDKGAVVYSRNPEICWLFNLRGNNTIFDAHGWPGSKIFLFKFLIKNVSGIVCNSGGTEKEYKKNGFTKTLVAPNGVDLEKFNIKIDVNEVRNELELPKDKKIILYVGHLYKWKGIDVVLDVASLLSDRDDVVFVIVGGTDKDIEKYKKIVVERKINNVRIEGRREQHVIPRYLKSSDVLLLPNVPISVESIKYTSPIKMFEYMASGKPIIASSLPSIREVLNDKNSLLFEPGSERDLVKKIEIILDNDGLSEEISRQALQDVRKYSWSNRAKLIIDFMKNSC